MPEKYILLLKPLVFYSEEDENLFFQWLKYIKCIENYKGVGDSLIVNLVSDEISFDDFKNLNGLFKRYKIKNIGQLKKFKIEKCCNV